MMSQAAMMAGQYHINHFGSAANYNLMGQPQWQQMAVNQFQQNALNLQAQSFHHAQSSSQYHHNGITLQQFGAPALYLARPNQQQFHVPRQVQHQEVQRVNQYYVMNGGGVANLLHHHNADSRMLPQKPPSSRNQQMQGLITLVCRLRKYLEQVPGMRDEIDNELGALGIQLVQPTDGGQQLRHQHTRHESTDADNQPIPRQRLVDEPTSSTAMVRAASRDSSVEKSPEKAQEEENEDDWSELKKEVIAEYRAENNDPVNLAKVYTRECCKCKHLNPARRVAMINCGHMFCFACSRTRGGGGYMLCLKCDRGSTCYNIIEEVATVAPTKRVKREIDEGDNEVASSSKIPRKK
ncbi:hypothetical protein PRIPAC_95991 [Pristionchus pacificus]|uniref:Uncharacterized protein n=1 Tax=Pristionchus pacificus TaxID=54126 RepID=A0A454XV10_PRIPA|nr:hypothetical protein PRIPAC_95991 [Pristionchus pacificus]|eukprot:PDM81695.1 hypothetical protein PRIPAC_30676 [Pristionchus pacificus]